MATLVTRHWKVAILWALSLVVTAVVSSSAQVIGPNQRRFDLPLSGTPTIVSGNDVGFRIERTVNGIEVRKLVLRIDGVWVDTDIPAGAGR